MKKKLSKLLAFVLSVCMIGFVPAFRTTAKASDTAIGSPVELIQFALTVNAQTEKTGQIYTDDADLTAVAMRSTD